MDPELGIRWDDLPGLRARAASLLGSGPLATSDLAADLLRLRYAPTPIAGLLVRELLAPDPRFEQRDGRWTLSDGAERVLRARLDGLDYVVVDLETTGGSPEGGDRITELAAIRVEGGRVARRFESLVNPDRPIPNAVTSLTNITEDMVTGAPRFAELADELCRILRGCVFVAHNAEFDWRFLQAEFARARGLRLRGSRICTLRLARRLHPELTRRNLRALGDYYSLDGQVWHRAGPDADTAAALFIRFLDRMAEGGIRDWGGLQDLLAGANGAGEDERAGESDEAGDA